MPIRSADLQWWFAGADRTLSSGRALVSNKLNEVFPDMSGASNRDSIVDYVRSVTIINQSALTLSSAKVFFKTVDGGGATHRIAWDVLGVVSGGGIVVSKYEDRPTVFSSAYVSFATGLALPASLAAGQAITLWIQRQGQNYPAGRKPERNTLTIQGTTPA